MKGVQIIQEGSKEVGITSLGKRLAALCVTFVFIIYSFICTFAYVSRRVPAKVAAISDYTTCKQLRDECPEDFREYTTSSISVVLFASYSVLCLCCTLFLIGTPAQLRLWKYWIASVLLCCRVADPSGKYKAWKTDQHLQRHFHSDKSFRRQRLRQHHIEMRQSGSQASNTAQA